VRRTERRGIAAKLGDLPEKRCIRGTSQQLCEQRIFPGACNIHLLGLAEILAVKVRPQYHARNPGRGLHRQHPLGRDPRPVGDGRLGDADPTRQLGNAADGADRLVEPAVAHRKPENHDPALFL